MEFRMERSYEAPQKFDAPDLLAALKHVMNYEGDLYVNGKLVFSALGLDHEWNAEVLKDYGITFYVNALNHWVYKWTDESKNVLRYFYHPYEYLWDGVPKVQFNVHDYRTAPDEIEVSTIPEIIEVIRKDYAWKFGALNINMVLWDDIHSCVTFSEMMPYFINGKEDVTAYLQKERDKAEEQARKEREYYEKRQREERNA